MASMVGRIILMAMLLFTAAPALAAGPGFDCAKATRQIDKAICNWYNVGSLDGRMAAAYKTAIAAQDGETAAASVKAGQKAWLAERDKSCGLDNVTPREGSEDGLSPKEFGQLICLQAIYPTRIAQLMDIAAAPLVPLDVKTVPTEPLQAAYPDDWQQAGYQALFSPDKTLMALGIEDGAGYVMQVWLYQPASGRLVKASPQTDKGPAETPEHISELNSWLWGGDGRFYIRARRPRGEDGIFVADMEGYAQIRDLPSDVAEKLAANDAARGRVQYNSDTPEEQRPPGFDDDSYDEQEGGAFTAWAQNRGHGSFDLMVARAGDAEPRIVVSGGWELRDFLFDPSGTRLFYNGEDGLVVTDPGDAVTRRFKGTRGMSLEVGPINLSAEGDILVYWAIGSCTRDAANRIDPDRGDDVARRVCLAYLPPAAGASVAAAGTISAKAADPWAGEWEGSGAGNLSARIRRGTAKPEYLVIDLVTGVPGCSGAVTLYGKPHGNSVIGESYDKEFSGTPVCRVELSLDKKDMLTAEEVGACSFYHGASCGFEGSLMRGE